MDSLSAALCAEQKLAPISATASSVEDSTFGPEKAIDNDPNTRWSSTFSDPRWLSIDLGSTQYISQVVLSWEAAASKDYDLQVSSDGWNWTTIHHQPNGSGGVETIGNLSATGRYLRIYSRARTTQWGVSLWSVEIYGDPNASCDAPVCGNGVVESGEQCDDGNTTDGDGCSSSCQSESSECASEPLPRTGATASGYRY